MDEYRVYYQEARYIFKSLINQMIENWFVIDVKSSLERIISNNSLKNFCFFSSSFSEMIFLSSKLKINLSGL